MKAQKIQSKRNKSLSKNNIKKPKTTNTSISLMNKKNNKKIKSKDILTNNTKLNSKRTKSNPKQIKNNNEQELIESNYYNNNINYNPNLNSYNFSRFNDNINYYNNDINASLNIKSSYDNNNKFKNTNYSQNYLYELNKGKSLNNDYIESSIIFKKTLDRLLDTSLNLVQKQNNILSECEILTKNVSMNDFSIQNIYHNENKLNFKNVMGDYATNINSILSHVKNSKINTEINDELKKENNLLKNKLEMINIDKDDNIKMKDGEISTLKIVLVSEINHILNFLTEIGYNSIPINKMEIADITSQNLTNFFELIIKIIKQMKEIIQKKEAIISKMTIEQNTLRTKNNENFSNKSFERLSLDYNNYNIGLKNYNISVTNSNQKRKYNISFRNYNSNKNLKNDFENNYDLELNNNNKNDLINKEKNELKNELDLIINTTKDRKAQIDKNIILNEEMDNNEKEENEVINNNDNKLNSDSYFYNREKKENNYSYDKGSNKSFKTGSFIIKENLDIKNGEINQNIKNEIDLKN